MEGEGERQAARWASTLGIQASWALRAELSACCFPQRVSPALQHHAWRTRDSSTALVSVQFPGCDALIGDLLKKVAWISETPIDCSIGSLPALILIHLALPEQPAPLH